MRETCKNSAFKKKTSLRTPPNFKLDHTCPKSSQEKPAANLCQAQDQLQLTGKICVTGIAVQQFGDRGLLTEGSSSERVPP